MKGIYGSLEEIEDFFNCSANQLDTSILRLYLYSADKEYLKGKSKITQLRGFDTESIGSEYMLAVHKDNDSTIIGIINQCGIEKWALSTERLSNTTYFWFQNQDDLALVELAAS
jgi:hypothetical protein